MDKQHVTLLVLFTIFDLSASAENWIWRFWNRTIDWLAYYLSDRSQRVSVGGVMSEKFDLHCGVPQGSCLGSLLFFNYSSKLFQIIQTNLPDAHCYVDAHSFIWHSKREMFLVRSWLSDYMERASPVERAETQPSVRYNMIRMKEEKTIFNPWRESNPTSSFTSPTC